MFCKIVSFEWRCKFYHYFCHLQINRIRKDTDSFIQEIRSFEDGKKMTIENYLENLRTEREALEDASKSCSIFVNNNPLMEIVKDEGKWRKELEKFTTDLNKSFVGTHDMTHLKGQLKISTPSCLHKINNLSYSPAMHSSN